MRPAAAKKRSDDMLRRSARPVCSRAQATGQVLFRIDPRPFQVALAQAWAQQAWAKAQLQFVQAEGSSSPFRPPRAARVRLGRTPSDGSPASPAPERVAP